MKVKICGITHPEDAVCATACGADYLGIVFSKNSRRNVRIEKAKELALITKQYGAESVAVFDTDCLDSVRSICFETGIRTIQLHGAARGLLNDLMAHFNIFCAITIDEFKEKLFSFPVDICPLFDSSQPGSGKPFDWKNFTPPNQSNWFLAGGLNTENISEAIRILKPYGVDASTGVETKGSIRKDHYLLENFIKKAKKLYETK